MAPKASWAKASRCFILNACIMPGSAIKEAYMIPTSVRLIVIVVVADGSGIVLAPIVAASVTSVGAMEVRTRGAVAVAALVVPDCGHRDVGSSFATAVVVGVLVDVVVAEVPTAVMTDVGGITVGIGFGLKLTWSAEMGQAPRVSAGPCAQSPMQSKLVGPVHAVQAESQAKHSPTLSSKN